MDTFQHSIEWQRKAIQLALQTMPNRGSQEFPIYGHSDQLLSRSAMIEQVLDVEGIARHDAAKCSERWARTGKWSRVSKRVAFFIEAALREAHQNLLSDRLQNMEDFHAPPWTKDDAAWLSAFMLSGWEFYEWLERWADDEFQRQERAFRSYHS